MQRILSGKAWVLIVVVLLFLYLFFVRILFPFSVDMPGMYKVLCYEDNVKLDNFFSHDKNRDIKYVYESPSKKRLVDMANGYLVDLEKGTEFDFSMSEFVVRAKKPSFEITISREYSPYEDVLFYINYYNSRFFTSESYQKANNITLYEDTTRDIGGKNVRIISLERKPYEGSTVTMNAYTYAYVFDKYNDRIFFRIMIKSDKYEKERIERIIASFTPIPVTGRPTHQIDTTPRLPSEWNEETKKLYTELSQRSDVMWGVYIPQLLTTDGMNKKINELEAKLDYEFPLAMGYTYLSPRAPVKGLEEAYRDGKVCELTLQISTPGHAGLDSLPNPVFEIIDGKLDDCLRSFARGIKEFGHPVLFRLNNEMNTDWTSYSGMVSLCDPDIYKSVFERVFNIFRSEGADNVIWIFNPQFGNYPPANWNNYLMYYPGADKIQLLGVTSYNTGEYYKTETGEQWFSFKEMYDRASELYIRDFADMPWIITEFASSSIGGNKANWIRNMFSDIRNYHNIKAAVWFSAGDYDPREGRENIIARPYFLDETPDTLKAFKDGLHGIFTNERLSEK